MLPSAGEAAVAEGWRSYHDHRGRKTLAVWIRRRLRRAMRTELGKTATHRLRHVLDEAYAQL